jgi:multidrug efflux pump subunit AcrA (membrane-fusion protein)
MPNIKTLMKAKSSLVIILSAGLILTFLIIKLQPQMKHTAKARPSIPVSYIEVSQHSIKPEIIGYGTVKPSLDLKAKAEVSGRVVYIHPELKKGEVFAKGTLLVQVDDKDYQLQLKQAEADLLVNQANLTEMQLTIENNELEFKLAMEKLKVRQEEYSRLVKLKKSGSISQSKLDAEKQNLLQQKQEVQQKQNLKTTLPSQLEVMKAQLAIANAKLAKSLRDLERTKITLPFNGRISEVFIEQEQYVSIGAALFDASGLSKVEINAQFPTDQFSLFAASFERGKVNFNDSDNIPSMTELVKKLGLTASIEVAGSQFKEWDAKVERFTDNLDPQSKTVGVVVSVEGSYQKVEPGKKPPLLEGMYMKVKLKGIATNYLLLPRFALHENQVYSVTKDNLLKRVKLSQIETQGNLALVNFDLNVGDRVITSDVFPAVDGMTLQPELDQVLLQQMSEWIGALK